MVFHSPFNTFILKASLDACEYSTGRCCCASNPQPEHSQQVFKEFADFCAEYGDVSVIPTAAFLAPLVPGQRLNVDLEKGKHLLIKFLSQSAELDEQGQRTVKNQNPRHKNEGPGCCLRFSFQKGALT